MDLKSYDLADIEQEQNAQATYAELYTSKHKFCFTHTDFDGIFSGEIVRLFFDNKVKIISLNYGDDLFDNILKKWDFTGCDVIICDFCFSDKVMAEIAKTAHSLTWLDHHASAIERMKKLDCFDKFHGIWNSKHSGAFHTWSWFFNNMKTAPSAEDVPEIINIISKFDTWTFAKRDKDFMISIQNGLKAVGAELGSPLFKTLLYQLKNPDEVSFDDYSRLFNEVQLKGQAVIDFDKNWKFKEYVRQAFDIKITVNGHKLVGCAINSPGYSDNFMYAYDKKRHDFCLVYYKLGNGKWTGSIYIMDDKASTKKVKAYEIARYFSPTGGGHENAAGFETKELPAQLR